MSLLTEHPGLASIGVWGAVGAATYKRGWFRRSWRGRPTPQAYEPELADDALLSRREQALVAAVADAFFPPDGPIPVSGQQAGLARYFNGYLGRSAPRQRFLMRLLMLFTELSPVSFGPVHKPFTKLSHAERLDFLQSASTSRIYFRRVAFVSLRALMTMAYLGNDEVGRHMNMEADTDPFDVAGGAP
jgi:hypothetical protein